MVNKILTGLVWLIFIGVIYGFLLTFYDFTEGSIPVNKLAIVAFIWVLGGVFASMAVAVDCDTLSKVGLKTCPITASRVTLASLSIVSFVGGYALLKSFTKEHQ